MFTSYEQLIRIYYNKEELLVNRTEVSDNTFFKVFQNKIKIRIKIVVLCYCLKINNSIRVDLF